jgi:hypothetical protein
VFVKHVPLVRWVALLLLAKSCSNTLWRSRSCAVGCTSCILKIRSAPPCDSMSCLNLEASNWRFGAFASLQLATGVRLSMKPLQSGYLIKARQPHRSVPTLSALNVTPIGVGSADVRHSGSRISRVGQSVRVWCSPAVTGLCASFTHICFALLYACNTA